MTKEERKAARVARNAALPGFCVSDGSTIITGQTGEDWLRIQESSPPRFVAYFNLFSVSLPEQLDLIRSLIGIYNWNVRIANQAAADRLPALEQLDQLADPPEGL